MKGYFEILRAGSLPGAYLKLTALGRAMLKALCQIPSQ